MTLPRKPESVTQAQKSVEEARKARERLAASPAAVDGKTLADVSPAKYELRQDVKWDTDFMPLTTSFQLESGTAPAVLEANGVRVKVPRKGGFKPGRYQDDQGLDYEIQAVEVWNKRNPRIDQKPGTEYRIRTPRVVSYWELMDPDKDVRERLMEAEKQRVAEIEELDKVISGGAPEWRRGRGSTRNRPGLLRSGGGQTILTGGYGAPGEAETSKTVLGG